MKRPWVYMSSPSHLYNLFQMPNDRRMVNVDFLGNFLCSCKGISFNDCSQLVVVNFFFFFPFIFISWRRITLQYCSGFCHTLTWISHGFTCIPHPDPRSHFPLYLIPLGLPSAPGPSTCLTHPVWAGDLFHTSDGQQLCSSSSRLSSPLQNFLNHPYTVCLLAVPEPNALWMLWGVSAALHPILTWIKKLFECIFCLTSFL